MLTSIDEQLLDLAALEAENGTCLRGKVGAVLACVHTSDSRVISRGYNTSLPGTPTCTDVGKCMIHEGHCLRTVHAEIICLHACSVHMPLSEMTLYTTTAPCWKCFQSAVLSGIRRLVMETDRYWSVHPWMLDHVMTTAHLVGAKLACRIQTLSW